MSLLLTTTPVMMDWDATLTVSFNLNYLFKDSLSKYNHILRYWCLGLQHMDLRGKLWSIKLLQKTIFCTVGTACTKAERVKQCGVLDIRLPRWQSGREYACQCRRCRFDPGVGKIHWRRKWQPAPLFLPGKSRGEKSLVGYGPWLHRVRHD